MTTRTPLKIFGVTLIVMSILYFQCGQKSGVTAPDGEAELSEYSHSDCIGESISGSFTNLLSDSADVEIIVEGFQITIIHKNATFNCCLDYIQVVLTQQNFFLKLTETEFVTSPCLCTCPFEVTATIDVPSPGTYTIELWAYDELLWSGEVEVGDS